MNETAFQGFSTELFDFLNELKANNNKAWFDQNRQHYKNAYVEPPKAFCDAMLPKLLDLTGIEHDAKRFRINRDIRFSKDKTPYNTHLHISFKPQARLIPTWFFGLSPDYLTAGVGTFGFDKPQLEAYRKRIDSPHGDALAASLEDLTNKGARISEPELKRLPKGFGADHRHGPLLRRKSLAVWMDFAALTDATSPSIVQTCCQKFSDLMPVFNWLKAI